MRYFVSFSHMDIHGNVGYGNTIITGYSMNTMDDMREVEKDIVNQSGCTNIVILNFIKLEDES